MFLEIFFETTKSPWNITDTLSFQEKLDDEKSTDLLTYVDELENILIVKSTLDSIFQVDFMPDSILEYSNFLWHSLSETMPTYQDITETKIIEALVSHDVPQPNQKQIKWTLNNWLNVVLDSKINLWINYFYSYFTNNNDEKVKNRILEVIEKHLFNNQVSKSYRLLYFIQNISPEETKTLLNKLLEENKEVRKVVEEILGISSE